MASEARGSAASRPQPAPYAQLVAEHGLSAAHRLVIAAVPVGARVLDVGCATGYLAAELARTRGAVVTGVESDPAAADVARAHSDEVIAGDADDPQTFAALDAGAFDVAVFADVLEHLTDPARALRATQPVLTPRDGLVIVSLPNIAHWTARRELLRGRFPKEDHGLFDRTHRHFFTLATARSLLQDAGLEIIEEHFAPAPVPLASRIATLRPLAGPATRWRPQLFALQMVLVARPR